jgi:uncharacterized protein
MKYKTVLITGASSGIGRELTKIFWREGYNVVFLTRDEKVSQILKKELDIEPTRLEQKSFGIVADLSHSTSPQYVYDITQKQGIQIDILVNNAGLGDYGYFAESKKEKQLQIIDVNVRALTEMTHLFVQNMILKKSGSIVNIASTAAFLPGPLMSVYFATKHFVLAFSEGLSNELSGTGVNVTCICPGPTKTNFIQTAHQEESGIVKNQKLPNAKDVAEFAYKAIINKKVIAIHGWKNKFNANISRVLPRFMVRKILRKVMDRA